MESANIKSQLLKLPEIYELQGIQMEQAYLDFKQAELQLENDYHKILLEIKASEKLTLPELEARVENRIFGERMSVLQKESTYRKEKMKLEKIDKEIMLICKSADLLERSMRLGIETGDLPKKGGNYGSNI